VALEEKVYEILNKVLDVSKNEVNPDDKLESGLGVDSTEMVEIAVGLKKELGVNIADNELKKSHSVNEIIGILKSKGAN